MVKKSNHAVPDSQSSWNVKKDEVNSLQIPSPFRPPENVPESPEIHPFSATISENSPIYPLQFLETGWDGYWAEPLSQEILFRANRLWMRIEQYTIDLSKLPTVQPAANGSVAFTWSHDYPEKELEIWLYDQPDYYAEWMLSVNDENEENTSQSLVELLTIIDRYQEL